MMNFNKIEQIAANIHQQALALDSRRKKQRQILFDDYLFTTRSTALAPYVLELKKTLKQLINDYQQQAISQEAAHYLSEKLIKQLEVIQKELKHAAVRKNFFASSYQQRNAHYGAQPKISLTQLYQDLKQHKEWERRLQEMIQLAAKQVQHCQEPAEKAQYQQKQLATEKRLERCSAARHAIERQIITAEKTHRR